MSCGDASGSVGDFPNSGVGLARILPYDVGVGSMGFSCLILLCRVLRSLTNFIVLLLVFSPAALDEKVNVIVSIDEEDAVDVELAVGFGVALLVIALLLLFTVEELLVCVDELVDSGGSFGTGKVTGSDF